MYKILAKPLFLGKQVFYMPSCHSTNDTAIGILDKPDIIEGCLVITDNQTSGKGQRGNRWNSEPGKNLTFTLVIRPRFLEIRHQFMLNIIISLAITDLLHELIPQENVKVKWPNDVYVNDQKIAGILIENTLNPPFIENSVVGIGLNVNQMNMEVGNAISLANLLNKESDLIEILERLVLAIETRYLELKATKRYELKEEYVSRLLGLNQTRSFYAEHPFKGIIIGISETGKLQVNVGHNTEEFDIKEIQFL